MVEVVQLLVRALAGKLKGRRVMLLLDACSIHMGSAFLRCCAWNGILVHFVPAKLTWLLQPLDTHAFARFKVFIGCAYRQEVMREGRCELSAMVRIVERAVRKILQGTLWAYAFDGNGFGKAQRQVRRTILEELDKETAVGPSSQLPTLGQFACMFPKRATLPLADLLAYHRRKPAGVAAPAPAAASTPPPAVRHAERGPWHGRLRSSSALSLSCADAPPGELSASVASGAVSGGASSSRDAPGAVPPVAHIERLFVPLTRPGGPVPLRKRKSSAR